MLYIQKWVLTAIIVLKNLFYIFLPYITPTIVAGNSWLNLLRKELRKLGVNYLITEATKIPFVTKEANQIQARKHILHEINGYDCPEETHPSQAEPILSKRGFNIHNTRIHKLQNHISNSSGDNLTLYTRVFCNCVLEKVSKTKAINEFKKTIVYLIQRQLSNHSSSVGSRCITIPCLESQFVGVFGNYIARYAPTQQTYECVFTGEYAYETLRSIFGDNNWGIRHYTGNQQTAVILFTPIQTDQEIDDNMKDLDCNTFSQDLNATKFEMKVKWERQGIKDSINHECTGGFLILRFTMDTAFF
ncbi:hypothetical protein C2G38_2152430 [Gigaspora rosea]|uniref:Uncharacterized protein n=1 Tax=Gigaspora rosea TaxID=44941 RepID=A0A397WDL3_9GLOM|nr:hypothetical protein C2G38_2152430 [Gigaspora rosea]